MQGWLVATIGSQQNSHKLIKLDSLSANPEDSAG